METIITAATIMTMYLNATSNADSPYYYNADIEDGKVKTMYVLDSNGEHLSNKLEYRFSYDSMGRLASKEVMRFNAVTGRHETEYRLDYTYKTDGYTMERREWNRRKQAYDRADIRTEYRKEFCNVVSVATYKWNEKQNDMLLVDNMLVLTPYDDYLLA